MTASEVNRLFLACDWVAAGGAVVGGLEAVQLLVEIIDHLVLQVLLDQVASDVEDVDRVREIAQDINERLRHLPTHIQVSVLILQQLNRMLN